MMDKIVGRSFIIASALLLFFPAQAALILKAFSMDGTPLKQAGAGQPFLLEVSLDANRSTQRPVIKGLDSPQIQISNRGLHMTSVNGHSTVKHSYKVRIDASGDYRLGPAELEIDGKKVRSNELSIVVGEQPIEDFKGQKKHEQGYAFMRLLADKDRVVVGEKITCAVRFYYADDGVSLEKITKQDASTFSCTNEVGPVTGQEEIDGIRYVFVQWHWDAYPTKPGDNVIPAYVADFLVQTKQERDFFSGFASLFQGFAKERKRVYSNALTIHVDPLPPFDGVVHAVGSFSYFSTKLEPGVAKEGEGMVLTMHVEGEGDLNGISMELQQMPESFKFYDSKNYMLDPKKSPSNIPTKCFEFVVQGMKAGNWEIPRQAFTYFDVQDKKYKTLESLPILVTILPQPLAGNQRVPPPTTLAPAQALAVTDEIYPLNTAGAFNSLPQQVMPFWLFVLFFIAPIARGLVDFGSRWRRKFFQHKKPGEKRKNACKQARMALEQLDRERRKKNIDAQEQCNRLYATIMQLFSSMLDVPESAISESMIEHTLQQLGVSKREFSAWQEFFSSLSEFVFFSKIPSASELHGLFLLAREWVDRLEKIV